MKTALEKLNNSIANETSGAAGILSFSFVYGEIVLEYMGRYYAYVHPVNDSRAKMSDEYCWDGYDTMLSAVITQTGKSVSEMLSEIPEHDLEIEFDVAIPPGSVQEEI